MAEVERRLELEVDPEDGTEWLHLRIRLPKGGVASCDESRKWLFEMESTPGKDAVKIVEMTSKDLEYYISFLDKAAPGFERIDSNCRRSSTVGEMLSNSTVYYQEMVQERKSQTIWQTPSLSNF